MSSPQVLRDMALFVEVAKRKSFSQAATALDIPVSSLSRRISQFEAAVGVRLLDRTTRKIALTAYGEAYLAQATRLVEEAQRSFDELVAQAKGPSGSLTLAVPTHPWVSRQISSIATDFARQNEHVRVHLDLRGTPADLVQDNYDLAIYTELPREASLIVRRIGSLENGLFAAPSYFETRRRPAHPRDLAEHDGLLHTGGTGATWQLSREAEALPVAVAGRISCNSACLARHLAVAGHGIAVLSLAEGSEEVEAGALEPVLPDWTVPATDVYVVTTSRLVPAKVRRFIDVLVPRLGTAFAEANRPVARDAGAGRHEAVPPRGRRQRTGTDAALQRT